MYYRIYKDSQNQWRWRYVSANGNTIADSGEGYHNKADCQRGVEIMKNSFSDPVYG